MLRSKVLAVRQFRDPADPKDEVERRTTERIAQGGYQSLLLWYTAVWFLYGALTRLGVFSVVPDENRLSGPGRPAQSGGC